jgi:hypothetical protein
MRKIRSRYLAAQIEQDLAQKMVFVAGPRQVGKTTLARSLPGATAGYLSWDVPADRERILRRELPPGSLWVFDELHKYRRWRNYLKGLYDSRSGGTRMLVTGSGRLDYYRFGGDSLQGRYHLLRLHPFSLAEIGGGTRELHDLLRLGGFPEPFLRGSDAEARRWSREHRTRLVQEDITSLERVQDLGSLEHLMLRLPDLVGAPLSINAVSEDLQVSHKAIASWLAILERLYAVFRVAPFGPPRVRALHHASKHYHFDWSVVPDEAARFENLVAGHLLKWIHFQQDAEGREVELRYFRTRDGREVDFVIVDGRTPVLAVECKLADREVDRGLRYLKSRYPKMPAWQISAAGRKDYRTAEGVRVAPATVLLRDLV